MQPITPETTAADHDRLVAVLRERSVRRQRVLLASGRESDFYVDCRATTLHPEGAALVARLLLAADELIYDDDRGLVTARGNVQFEYDGTTVVAETGVYDRNTRRVIASGNVEILEPGGNRITADRIAVLDQLES